MLTYIACRFPVVILKNCLPNTYFAGFIHIKVFIGK